MSIITFLIIWEQNKIPTKATLWLVYPIKNSGKPRIQYNDAVEEALSFGWIDSIVKRVDEFSSAQRFSPRNPNSDYSQANKERLKWLIREDKLHSSVIDAVEKALSKEFVFPSDILEVIKGNEKAWRNYQNFSPAYQRIRIAYINSARNRPYEFKKRLHNFVNKTERNKLIGFGGIQKYF